MHTAGGTHPTESPTQPGIDKNGNYLDKGNLMIQGTKNGGTDLTRNQLKMIKNEIDKDAQ